jgi:hypothetical protein
MRDGEDPGPVGVELVGDLGKHLDQPGRALRCDARSGWRRHARGHAHASIVSPARSGRARRAGCPADDVGRPDCGPRTQPKFVCPSSQHRGTTSRPSSGGWIRLAASARSRPLTPLGGVDAEQRLGAPCRGPPRRRTRGASRPGSPSRRRLAAGQGELDLGLDDRPELGDPLRSPARGWDTCGMRCAAASTLSGSARQPEATRCSGSWSWPGII